VAARALLAMVLVAAQAGNDGGTQLLRELSMQSMEFCIAEVAFEKQPLA
jgi:hypothetical protein